MSDARAPIPPAVSLRTELGVLAGLSWPNSLAMFAFMGMNVVDAVTVGQLGADAQAGVSSAMAWGLSGAIFGIGMVRAIEPIVAQAHGEGDERAIAGALVRMLWLCAPLSVLVGAWHLAAGPALRYLEQPPSVVPMAEEFAFAMAFCWPAALLLQTLRTFLQALGIVRPAMVAMLLGTAAKIPLNLLLIHGAGPVPALGVTGAAVSTCAIDVGLLALLAWLVRGTLRRYLGRGLATSAREVWSLFRVGLPLGVQMGTEFWAFSALVIMMGWLGKTEQAAHTVAINLASLAFMVPLGISMAAGSRVGQLFGAGLAWGRAAAASLLLGGAAQVASGLAFLFLGPVLVQPYSSDVDVLEVAAVLMPIAAAFQLFDGVQVVGFGVLRGAGDVRVPTLANVLGYYALGLPLGYWWGIRHGGGPTAIWWGISLGLAVVALVLLWRIRFVYRRGGVRIR